MADVHQILGRCFWPCLLTGYLGIIDRLFSLQKIKHVLFYCFSGIAGEVFGSSSMVEQEAVNFEVAGSSPAAGAKTRYLSKSPVSIDTEFFAIITSLSHQD